MSVSIKRVGTVAHTASDSMRVSLWSIGKSCCLRHFLGLCDGDIYTHSTFDHHMTVARNQRLTSWRLSPWLLLGRWGRGAGRYPGVRSDRIDVCDRSTTLLALAAPENVILTLAPPAFVCASPAASGSTTRRRRRSRASGSGPRAL